MIKITLSKKEINAIDLSSLFEYVEWHKDNFKYFNLDAGIEHYRLLAYLSTVIPSTNLIDIGTYLGFSAVALSYNNSKQVYTYDIYDWLPDSPTKTVRNVSNVTVKIMNCLNDLDIILNTDLILLDIDHNGSNELEILNVLRKNNYKGLLLLDDIGLNPEMIELWENIPEKKIDISDVGHFSKTGLVIFDPDRFEIETV